MWPAEAQKKGGQVMAVRQRREALKRYYENPVRCKFCNAVIKIKEGQKASEVRKKKFCDQSCAASFNNPRREKEKKKFVCLICGGEKSRYSEMCRSCHYKQVAEEGLKSRTKGELFQKATNWQSARSTIQIHARKAFVKRKRLVCERCGYRKFVDVCHKVSVSSFSDDTLISEINGIDNLVGLCPNCHRELDNGLFNLARYVGEAPRDAHNVSTPVRIWPSLL